VTGHVRDRWTDPGPNGRRVRNKHWGRGRRWQARWIERGHEKGAAFATKDGAEAHLARVTSGGGPRPRSNLTVEEYAPRWLAEQLHYAAHSRSTAEGRIHSMILPHLGDEPLDAVRRVDVQRVVVIWTAAYAPASVHLGYSFLSSMFEQAHEDGLIERNPCAGTIHLPTVDHPPVIPLTVEQVQTIADDVNPRYRSLVIVAAATGMRGAELRGLTIDRVLGGDVRVDRQLVGIRTRRPVWGPPKSGAGTRRIALGHVAESAIAVHLATYGAGVDGLIWTTRQHGPISRTRAAEVWHHATASLERPTRDGWHELRHFHASVLIQQGATPKDVAERLGHKDASETLKTYAHLWPADHERMADITDAALARLIGEGADVIPLRRAL
jgi:integrase